MLLSEQCGQALDAAEAKSDERCDSCVSFFYALDTEDEKTVALWIR